MGIKRIIRKNIAELTVIFLVFAVSGFFYAGCWVDNTYATTTGKAVTEYEIDAVQLVDDLGVKFGTKTIDNKARTVTETYFYNIGLGTIADHVPVSITGHTAATKLNVLVDLSHLATDAIPVPVAMPSVPVVAVAMEVVSTDADDYASGTGARSVYIEGLDLDGVIASETLALDAADGTTPVATVGSYSRINCFSVVTAGSSAAAEGTISLRHVSDTPVYSAIPALFNEASQAHFTVPAGQVFIITGWSSGATGKESFIYLQATVNVCNDYALTPGIYHVIDMMSLATSHTHIEFTLPISLPALTDIKLTSESTNAAGGTATGTIEGFYEPSP